MKTIYRTFILQALYAFCACTVLNAQVTLAVGALEGNSGVSADGAAQYFIPIDFPPGIDGMQPNLSISYNSRSGDGAMGMGWSFSGLSSVSRAPISIYTGKGSYGINFASFDDFLLDGNRLVYVSGNPDDDLAIYKTETETFQQVEFLGGNTTSGSGPDHIRVLTKDGKTIEYGNCYFSKFNLLT